MPANQYISPATTYTLDDFVEMQYTDDMTYYNFSILEVVNGVEHLDTNLVEEYLPEIKDKCVEVELSTEEFKKYKYKPDILAFDIYGSVQLDFVILLINDTFDPKEFDKKKIILPHSSILSKYLNDIYSTELLYIQKNRSENGLLV